MKRFVCLLQLALPFSLAWVSQSALAIECDDKSRNFSRLGEKYFEFSYVPEPTSSELRDLQSFVENVYGDWTFETQEITCHGIGDNVRKIVKKGRGTAVFSKSRLFPLEIEMDTSFDDTRRNDTVELLALDASFGFNIARNRISHSQFHRSGRRISIFYEYDYLLTSSKDKVDLQVDFYASGLFFARKTMRFKRR